MHLYTGFSTDVGAVRECNEDAVIVENFTAHDNARREIPVAFLAVADGMGGHVGGAIASSTIIEAVSQYLRAHFNIQDSSAQTAAALLSNATSAANAQVYRLAQEQPELRSMGATLTMALVVGNQLTISNVGDSRAYLLREQMSIQLTRDHSLVQQKIDAGVLTREEAAQSTERNILVRVVGLREEVVADIVQEQLNDGDAILLCTDGLHGAISLSNIAEAFAFHDDPQITCNFLVGQALLLDGSDNITTAALRLYERQITPGNSSSKRRIHINNAAVTRQFPAIKPRFSRRHLMTVLLLLVFAGIALLAVRSFQKAPTSPIGAVTSPLSNQQPAIILAIKGSQITLSGTMSKGTRFYLDDERKLTGKDQQVKSNINKSLTKSADFKFTLTQKDGALMEFTLERPASNKLPSAKLGIWFLYKNNNIYKQFSSDVKNEPVDISNIESIRFYLDGNKPIAATFFLLPKLEVDEIKKWQTLFNEVKPGKDQHKTDKSDVSVNTNASSTNKSANTSENYQLKYCKRRRNHPKQINRQMKTKIRWMALLQEGNPVQGQMAIHLHLLQVTLLNQQAKAPISSKLL